MRPEDGKLLLNRSAAALAMGNLQDALADAQSALKCGQSESAKAYYRLGSIWLKMESWSEAARAFEEAMQIENNNDEIVSGRCPCSRDVMQQVLSARSSMRQRKKNSASIRDARLRGTWLLETPLLGSNERDKSDLAI